MPRFYTHGVKIDAPFLISIRIFQYNELLSISKLVFKYIPKRFNKKKEKISANHFLKLQIDLFDYYSLKILNFSHLKNKFKAHYPDNRIYKKLLIIFHVCSSTSFFSDRIFSPYKRKRKKKVF